MNYLFTMISRHERHRNACIKSKGGYTNKWLIKIYFILLYRVI